MDLTDFIEQMFLPAFKKAEAEGNVAECVRLLKVLADAVNAGILQVEKE